MLMKRTNQSAGEAITVTKLYHFDTDHDRLFRQGEPTLAHAET